MKQANGSRPALRELALHLLCVWGRAMSSVMRSLRSQTKSAPKKRTPGVFAQPNPYDRRLYSPAKSASFAAFHRFLNRRDIFGRNLDISLPERKRPVHRIG